MRKDEALAILAEHRHDLREMGVGSLSLIGDIVNQEVAPECRIELLIELSSPMGYFKFFEIQFAIEKWLNHEVFMVTPDELDPDVRRRVQVEAVRAA